MKKAEIELRMLSKKAWDFYSGSDYIVYVYSKEEGTFVFKLNGFAGQYGPYTLERLDQIFCEMADESEEV